MHAHTARGWMRCICATADDSTDRQQAVRCCQFLTNWFNKESYVIYTSYLGETRLEVHRMSTAAKYRLAHGVCGIANQDVCQRGARGTNQGSGASVRCSIRKWSSPATS